MTFNLDQHQADAVLITCIDFRFHNETLKYVKENLADSFDLITAPGTAKNFIEANAYSQEIISAIKDVCQGLHQVKKIILMGHWDCGGYGGSKNFTSTQEEELKYQIDLKQAKQILVEKFPNLEIIIGYSKVTDNQINFLIIK